MSLLTVHMSSDGNKTWAPVWELVRRGPFARYIRGEAISMTGTWMQVMAQSWVVAELTQRAFLLGLVNFASGIPMVALTIYGGIVADRYDKRKILMATQVAQILLAILLGTLVALRWIEIWHVMVVALIQGISNAFEMPSASALVPELVPRNHLPQAIAIDRSVFHGTRLIGPALAGYVVGLWGPALAFYANALSFVALIIALLTLAPRPHGSPEEEAHRRGGMKDGIAFVRADRPTMTMIGLMATATVFVFPVMIVMLPLYVKVVLGLGPDRMGVLMGAAASGSLTGAIGLLAVRRDQRLLFMTSILCGIALCLLGLSWTTSFGGAIACMVPLSWCVSSLIGLANTIVQERAPDPLRGRVSAVASLSFFGLMPFAGLGITSVSDWLGMRTCLALAGLAYGALSLWIISRSFNDLRAPSFSHHPH